MAFASACGNENLREEERKKSKGLFHTTDPSRLYFKNIRSASYQLTEQPGTRVEFYQLRQFDPSPGRPVLIPVIANNWMQDEAYLLIRTNEYVGGFADTLRIFWTASDSSGSFDLTAAGFPQQYAFARRLSAALRAGHELRILTAGADTVPVFSNYGDRSHFQTTLRDFEKLIERK